MSYRDTTESLTAYKERLVRELAEAKDAARAASAQAKRASQLEKDLAETERLLASLNTRRALPLLERLTIAAPCTARWEEMSGDDRTRFCGHCQKNVYNLSAMPREEAEALVVAREGNACVRMYKRTDGTVMTSECAPGIRRRRRRRAAVAAMTAVSGSFAAVAGMGVSHMGKPVAAQPEQRDTVSEPAVMGSIAPIGEPPPPVPSATPTGHWVAGGLRPRSVP